MQAVILAGGKGTRLKPYTTILPKPLMPIGDKAILEVVILQLKKAGFTEIILTVGYLAELIEAYFGNGEKWGIKIKYSREPKPLGTAGPLTLIDGLADEFLVMNGDILCDLDFKAFMDYHLQKNSGITICGYTKKVKIDLGILEQNKGVLSDYVEKPQYEYEVSTGIYAFNKSAVLKMKKGEKMDIPDLIRNNIGSDLKIDVYHFKGMWFDIGSVGDYQDAQEKYNELEK